MLEEAWSFRGKMPKVEAFLNVNYWKRIITQHRTLRPCCYGGHQIRTLAGN